MVGIKKLATEMETADLHVCHLHHLSFDPPYPPKEARLFSLTL